MRRCGGAISVLADGRPTAIGFILGSVVSAPGQHPCCERSGLWERPKEVVALSCAVANMVVAVVAIRNDDEGLGARSALKELFGYRQRY